MSDPVSHLKRELLAAAERQQRDTVLAPKSRRPWLERFRPVQGRRRRLVVVLTAVVLATAATTAGWAIVHEVVLHKGFIGLPPVGATPSAPASGELVIQYWVDTEDMKPANGGRGANGARGWVYADGRLITLPSRGFLEQRLTPEGVELLRSEIVSTGLFEHPQPVGPSPHNVIQVRIGDRLVRAQAKGAAASDEFPKQLREKLADPASWLPASAWEERQIRAYVASRYSVGYHAQPQTLERTRILSLLPPTAEDMLRAKDAVPHLGQLGYAGFPLLPITGYSSELTTEEARALAQVLDDAGLKRRKTAGGLEYFFEIRGTSVDPPRPEKGQVRNKVFIGLSPDLPHGESICSECG
jgi:hypothetical protein